ncbi:WecB/TagA/CpsF family glycosyltransferase [Alkalicoccus halolimnae]|uniref:N-acetylglucosaminyldiphosphoundecaprenol N-acetyl-beta-D-mannosaminyltransferase n=1 Tax=Alkalicoccus halolimnae TaxID=1667239 RepID=A0A5C7FHJ9_9BACI|nr:WecB/TagA/CpsF family glycosyltransferase [Alkalicoccus halolimnae]TXF85619.1 WecB/TagA/CpsF family glycosyltransferase [Alkalicoccus halolimnae]
MKLVTSVKQSIETVTLLGVPFVKTTLSDMAVTLAKHAESKEKAFVVTANPEIVLHTQNDREYHQAIEKATYVTADGIGIVKGARFMGHRLPERVTGFDLFMRLLGTANELGQSAYFLGAREAVLNKTLDTIHKEFPGLVIAGSHHGFFDWTSQEIAEEIKTKKPDYVFVALGFPLQEKWIARNFPEFDQGIFIGIGGSFDVLAGEVKRAPYIWQKWNVEWLYRLVKQPARCRRMAALPWFIFKVMKEKIKR